MTVRDVMQKEVWTVSASLAAAELARELISRRISGAPVVDDHGQIVGVASLHDVAAAPARPAKPGPRWGHYWDMGLLDDGLLDALSVEGSAGHGRVCDIMTPAVHTISPEAHLSEAADLLIAHHIHRLIVTENGQPVGIVTSTDLMRVLRNMLKVTA